MNVFIDTNVFLSFFCFTKDDLEELRKLAVLLDDRQLSLLLPTQVVHEFNRNRENKIAEAFKTLSDQKLSLTFPRICEDYAEYGHLRKLQGRYSEVHSSLVASLRADAAARRLKADQIIYDLFAKAKQIDCDDELVDRARNRVDIGNPPGKKGSLGDAINWESLLREAPQGEEPLFGELGEYTEEFHFISEDSDYRSLLNHDALSSFLRDEWRERKFSSIKYYQGLSQFLSEHFSHIRLASEYEKDSLIRRLAESETFQVTRGILRRLKRCKDLTPAQANRIVDAALDNTQVRWIARDWEVSGFLTGVIAHYEGDIDPDRLQEIRALLVEEAKADDEEPAWVE